LYFVTFRYTKTKKEPRERIEKNARIRKIFQNIRFNLSLLSLLTAASLVPNKEVPSVPKRIKYCTIDIVYANTPTLSGPRTLLTYGAVMNGMIIEIIWYMTL